MKKKTNAEMLKSLKQCNKVARENRALREGFKSAEAMITFLNELISLGNGDDTYSPTSSGRIGTIEANESSETTTIHIVDVLDASGSMNGAKYTAAVKGINMGIKSLREDTANVNYTYTLCDFSDEIIFRHKMAELSSVKDFKGSTRGMTALYDAIGQSVDLIKESRGVVDKVLVNIYTDGQENVSRKFTRERIASMIEDLSKGNWTFTFIGTKVDVGIAQSNLKFDASNTLIHDNTGSGMEKAFVANNLSRSAYSAKVEKGEDVSIGFYKDIN